MRYSGDLITLNGQNVPCITSYKLGRCKLWGSDTGRNMAGSMKGTLVGIFPKITLEVGYTSDDDMSTLENILDMAVISVTYYSNKYKTTLTADYYASDYDENLGRKEDMTYAPFTVSLVPNESEDYHVRS